MGTVYPTYLARKALSWNGLYRGAFNELAASLRPYFGGTLVLVPLQLRACE